MIVRGSGYERLDEGGQIEGGVLAMLRIREGRG